MENNKELIDEIVEDEQLTYTADEVACLLEEVIPSIEIDTKSCQESELNLEEFKKGVMEVSSICGMLSAFMGTGLSNELALELTQNIILTKEKYKADIEISKINQNNIAQNQI